LFVVQVSLFCLAIGQDPKQLPLAVVNLENEGRACDGFPEECPISLSSWGIPSKNEYLQNFTCRYLSFLDRYVYVQFGCVFILHVHYLQNVS
jgi:hypothetical protein